MKSVGFISFSYHTSFLWNNLLAAISQSHSEEAFKNILTPSFQLDAYTVTTSGHVSVTTDPRWRPVGLS